MHRELENTVALMGYMSTDLEEIRNIHGQPYNGWKAKIKTVRNSGVEDETVIIMPKETDTNGMVMARTVMVIGKIQTFKNFNTKKVLVYVLAEYAAPIEGKYWDYQNKITLIGKLGKGITYRETPNGKRITDIKVIVPNALKTSRCYIPCICWQQTADEVKDWDEGTEVELTGRLQSREYTKRLSDDTEEQRICYEVSVSTINKKG